MEAFQIDPLEEEIYQRAEDFEHLINSAVFILIDLAMSEKRKEEFTKRAQYHTQLFRERVSSNWFFKQFLSFKRKRICTELKDHYKSLLNLKQNGIATYPWIRSGGQFRKNLEDYVKEFLMVTGTCEVVQSGEFSSSLNITDCYICLCFLRELSGDLSRLYIKIRDPKK